MATINVLTKHGTFLIVLEIPDKPLPAILEVIGSTSLLVRFANTKNHDSKRMLSKYKGKQNNCFIKLILFDSA